ncbi:uncharacterized protein [Mytilus edulis]|uniref:uncharacterized protein n=1 Tax=Mytilus edulis TaxID=6550 RepID=UPI0039F13F5C
MTINCTAVGGQPPPEITLVILGTTYTGNQSRHHTFSPQRSDDGHNVTCQAGYTDINHYPLTVSAQIHLKHAHTSSKAIIGTVAGVLVVLLIVCVVFISILIIKKRKGTKKTKKNAGFHENSGFQNVQIGDEYEEVISKSDTEEKQTSKTYEALRPMEAVEVYDNLENDKGLPSSKSTSKTYESLGTKDAVNVYDDLDNHKDLPSSKPSVDPYDALSTQDKTNVYEELENQKEEADKVYVNEAF